jgi:hypothetical protein
MLAKEWAEKNREKRDDLVRVVRRREPIRRRSRREERGEGAVRLRRICPPPFRLARRSRECGTRGECPPPLAVNLNQDASHNNKGRRRQRSVAVVNLKKGTGTLLTSVMKTTVGF